MLILAAILIFFIYRGCESRADLKEQIGLYEAAQDTLHQTRNELGQQITSISLLQADKEKDLLKLKTNDSTIIALQKVVKEYKGKLDNATVFGNSTNDAGSSETIIKWDTLKTDTGSTAYPTYTSNWVEKWSEGNIKATKDSIFRDIKIKNEFEMTMGKENQGFLKKRKSVVTIKNLNPNTITTELRTFTVEPHKNKFSFGIGAAYGYDLIGLKPTIVVGATVHFPLISF